jgi:hypothetical protein
MGLIHSILFYTIPYILIHYCYLHRPSDLFLPQLQHLQSARGRAEDAPEAFKHQIIHVMFPFNHIF